jgi:hypothetical protein
MTTIKKAEQRYTKTQAKGTSITENSSKEEVLAKKSKDSVHIDLAAG